VAALNGEDLTRAALPFFIFNLVVFTWIHLNPPVFSWISLKSVERHFNANMQWVGSIFVKAAGKVARNGPKKTWNYLKLSWKSTTCVSSGLQRTSFAPSWPYFKEQAPERHLHPTLTCLDGKANGKIKSFHAQGGFSPPPQGLLKEIEGEAQKRHGVFNRRTTSGPNCA
jgi:hypothetical protein